MKKLLLLSVFFSLGYTNYAQQIQRIKITDLTTLIDTANTPLVINFWASWCLPCIHEIPWLEKDISNYPPEKIKLILVSLDFPEDYPAKLSKFIKKKNYQSQIMWLDETDANTFCPAIDKSWEGAIPATLFINNTKQYRLFYNGQISNPRFKQELQKTVNGQ